MKTNASIYPHGSTNANWFSLFNAVSFQITLGAPMILYAKSIGATATVLGIIASLPPLLTICQIPAAHYLERVGYKRFIFYGWGLRTLCIFAIAFVPLMGFFGNVAKILLILALLGFYVFGAPLQFLARRRGWALAQHIPPFFCQTICTLLGLLFMSLATVIALLVAIFNLKGRFFRLLPVGLLQAVLLAAACLAPYVLWGVHVIPGYSIALGVSTGLVVLLVHLSTNE